MHPKANPFDPRSFEAAAHLATKLQNLVFKEADANRYLTTYDAITRSLQEHKRS